MATTLVPQVGDEGAATEPLKDSNDSTTSAANAALTIDQEIQAKLEQLGKLRDSYIYPLFIGEGLHIDSDTVDDVYDSLTDKCAKHTRIEVVINSGGGDLHAAYSLGLLFRRFGSDRLRFIVPRWAKSAATLLVCAGDLIYMGSVAELGPLDPQITQMNPLERRLEEFSPLHIEATLELIRDEFKSGHTKLANGLLQRLQFPLTLGGFKKSLEIGKEYLTRLLSSRMFKAKRIHAREPMKSQKCWWADIRITDFVLTWPKPNALACV